MPENIDDTLATMTDAQILIAVEDAGAGEVLARLAGALAAAEAEGPPAEEFARALAARESVGSTALGKGVALPHCRLPGLEHARVAIARSRNGVAFGAPDGAPVRLFVALATPSAAPGVHLRLLSELARRLRGGDIVARVLAASTAREIREQLASAPAAAGVR